MSEHQLSPARAVRGVGAYAVPRGSAPISLRLDGNEGLRADGEALAALAGADADLLRRYPSTDALRERLAAHVGVAPERVLPTCGGDDALDRAFRAMLEPGREVVLPVPTFTMFHHYARWTGATVKTVPWDTPAWPRQAVIDAISPATSLVALVSPNNPTGYVLSEGDLRAVAAAATGAMIVLDHAYVEFADENLTAAALELPNVVVFRTLSKAWGLAGLRIGYAVGPAELIGWLRAGGNPYTVSGPSAWLACHTLERSGARMERFVARIRTERADLESRLRDAGLEPTQSQGNFVFVRTPRADWLRSALASLGIAVRGWPGSQTLADGLRITLPGDDADYARLTGAIDTALAPEALLFDMDGVLVDVRHSYRAAIVQTCAAFGATVRDEDIRAAKDAGNANNDWVISQRLLAAAGIQVPLAEVTATFERLYQGDDNTPGLRERESLLIDRRGLERLRQRSRLGIVTGRPRSDAHQFLDEHGIRDLFDTIVCMEDGPAKPDPAPVRRALAALNVTRAWMLGDTPDDTRSAVAAGVVSIGVAAPGEDLSHTGTVLREAGAARVLSTVNEVEELLP